MIERKQDVAEKMIGTGSPLTFRTGEALAESLRDSRSAKGKGKGKGWLT